MVRQATREEQAAVEALAKTDKATKDFPFLWRRNQNWDQRSNPVVAVIGGDMVGFHACAYGQTYANSYYQLVRPDQRGKGLGGEMVAKVLRLASAKGCTRLKFKVPKGGDGQTFWEGFGVHAIGADDVHFLYDLSLAGVVTPSDLANAIVGELPITAVRNYLRAGVVFNPGIVPAEGRLWDE